MGDEMETLHPIGVFLEISFAYHHAFLQGCGQGGGSNLFGGHLAATGAFAETVHVNDSCTRV